MAGRTAPRTVSLPHQVARAVRNLQPIVYIITFGASAAFAQSAVTTPVVPVLNAPAAYTAPGHDALIAERRAGRVTPAQALTQLKEWLATPLSDAQRQRVASDAIVLAAQDAQYAEAVAIGRRVPPAALADYALASLAVAARRTHDAALLGDTVKVWRARQPSAREPRVHEAYALLEAKDVAGARAAFTALPAPATVDERLETLELHAAIARAEGDPLQALAAYTEVIALRPSRTDARRAADFLVADSGGPSAAFEGAKKLPAGTFSPLSTAWLEQQALGQRLRWATKERDERLGATRVEALDRVLADEEAALARVDAQSAQDPADADAWRAVRTGLQSDRLLALVERGRPADAVALYDQLHADNVDLPPYALSAAAHALTQLRRSVEAVPLYEAAIAKAGNDATTPNEMQYGLVYAYQDSGRFDEADALLKRMEAATPVLMRLTPEPGRPNVDYTDVVGLRGLFSLYTDRPQLAQQTFAGLTEYAPLNPGYGYGAAVTERLREHPEAAVARFEALTTNSPYDISARAGQVEALIDAAEFGEARRRAESLTADAPDAAETRDTNRKLRAATAPRLDVDAETSRGGSTLANSEWRVDSRLSSGLINDEWRLFYDQSLGRGDTSIGNANWSRAGLGLSWQRGRWLAEGALQQANSGPYRTSFGGRLDYRAGDNWRLSATYDGNTRELPWKARVSGVGAHEFGASAGYVVNESRRFDFKYSRMDFSDGNLRNGLEASWSERWISTPRFQLETKLAADGSHSSDQDVAYFSPSSDSSVGLTVRGQWLNWKSDDRQFFQAVELSTGSYRQAGFGSGPQWSIRYEHRWEIGPRFTLRYGLTYGSHPYDGVRERQRGAFLNLSTPLQ